MNSRAAATIVVCDVIKEGMQLSEAFERLTSLPTNEQAYCKALVFGTLRWRFQLQLIVNQWLKKPLKSKEMLVYCLLLVGAYQCLYGKKPQHVIVNETVNALKPLKKPWAKGLVNAVLRQLMRNKETLLETVSKCPEGAFAHPTWLYEKITNAWPNQAEDIFLANNTHPPMCLRVNATKISRDDYVALLVEKGIGAKVSPVSRYGITIDEPCDVALLPKFGEGWVSVQDEAAQLLIEYIQLEPELRVLDVCAAPGGKAAHMLEVMPSIQLTALDISKKRISRMRDNFERLGVTPTAMKCADATTPELFEAASFERIVLDAPCTATGVIRRHPDIKSLRTPKECQQVVKTQSQLLDAVWPYLGIGGILVYATCSVLPEENEAQVESFLARYSEAKLLSRPEHIPSESRLGTQLLPSANHTMDGFYYAAIKKMR